MTTNRVLTQNRRIVIAAAGIVLIAAALAAFLATRGSTSGAAPAPDSALRSTATRFLTRLNHPLSRLPVVDSSLNSFKAWVYDTQPIFVTLTARPAKQFEQVQFVDPSPFPPQAVTITSPGHTAIYPASTVYNGIIRSYRPFFATVRAQGKVYRLYASLLQVPAILRQVGVYAILEVIEPQS